MGEDLLKQIVLLVKNLPPKDIKIGERFVEERKFEELKELIDSAIYKEKKRVANGQESLVRDFTGLVVLKSKVDRYCSYLEIPEQEEELDDFDACETWDEYD